MNAEELTHNFIQAYYSLVGARKVKTKKDFSDSIGMHSANFILIERGLRKPTVEQICQLVERYNISAAWLFGQSDKFLND